MKNEASELSCAKLDLVWGAEKPSVSFEVNLGNMIIGGYATDTYSMGYAATDSDTRVHSQYGLT